MAQVLPEFFPFLRPCVSTFLFRLVCWNGLIAVFTQSGSALSCVTGHISLSQAVTSMISGEDGNNNFFSKSNPLYLKLQYQKIATYNVGGRLGFTTPFVSRFLPKPLV